MDYDKVAFKMNICIFKNVEINNNSLRFQFMNCTNSFYELTKSYYKILGLEISEHIMEICILFEYLSINQLNFYNIYQSKIDTDCLNLLSYLNLNICLLKKLNYILSNINCNDYLLEILDNTKYTDYLKDNTYDLNKIKKKLVNVFIKIITR